MATFRVKLHDTTLPLTVDTDLTGASVKAFIRSARAEGEVPAVVPVNVTDPVVGAFDLVLAEVGSGEFDLEVLVEKDGEQVRTPSVGFDRLVVGPNLDDPLAAPYVPSATLEQVIEEKFAGQADRLIPFAATAQEAAADAGVFAAATEFDANRAGESAFQSGQSAGYALGHRNAAQASADTAEAAAALITTELDATVDAAVQPAVSEAISNNPSVVQAAAALAQSDAGLVRKGSPLVFALGSNDEYPFYIVDVDGRLGLGIKADGSVEGKFLLRDGQVARRMLSSDVPIPETLNALGHAYVIRDADGRKSFWITDDGSVELAKMGAGFTRIILDALSAAGLSTVATKFRSTYGTTETKVVSGPDITLAGHSMLAQASSAVAAALPGVSVTSLAVGGETSRTIAARQGGQPMLVVPAGGQIPASGGVDLALSYADGPLPSATGASGWPLLQGASSYAVTLALPDGTRLTGSFSVVRDAAAEPYRHHSGDRYVFTRATNGSAITLARPTAMYYDVAGARREDIFVYWAGRNNLSEPDQIIADINAMTLHQRPLRSRYLVLGESTGATETSGTSAHTSALTINTKYRQAYGRRFIDVRRYLIDYGLADAGITPTTQDQTDIANDTVPASLRSDSLHLNAAGHTIVAALIRNRLNELGWTTS